MKELTECPFCPGKGLYVQKDGTIYCEKCQTIWKPSFKEDRVRRKETQTFVDDLCEQIRSHPFTLDPAIMGG